MDASLNKNIRRNSVTVAILIVVAIFGVLFLIPANALSISVAIVAFTGAIALPIHQKRLSFPSLFLFISGILFLLSGVIGNTADNFTSNLSISSQIEFSKFLHPRQVSIGLSNIGIGMCNVVLAWFWLTSLKNEPLHSKIISWTPLVLIILGILFIILGVSSTLNGLSRL
jgi:hypothetical protein